MPFFLLTSIFSGDNRAHQAEGQSERNPHENSCTDIARMQTSRDMRKSWVNNMLLKRGFSSLPWKESHDKARQNIKKQRHRFANKRPYSPLWIFQ